MAYLPLDGWAMEMLEMRRAALPPKTTRNSKKRSLICVFGNSLIV